MLYDHGEDPGGNVNVSERDANAALVERFTKTLLDRMGEPNATRAPAKQVRRSRL